MPLVQNVNFYDKVQPDARQPRARPDDDVGEEAAARRFRRALADHRRAPVLHLGAGRRGSRAAAAVADGARESRRGVQQARRARGDLDGARRDHDGDAAEGRTPTRSRSASRSSTCGCAASSCRPTSPGPVYQRMESERRRVANELRSLGGAESEKIRADADRQRQVILADAYRAGAEDQGRRRRQGVGDLRAGVRAESRVLRVLPQPRGVQVDVPQQERPDGARSERRVLPVLQAVRARARTARAARRSSTGSPGRAACRIRCGRRSRCC